MYLCIYIGTHLHAVYQNWLLAVLPSKLRYALKSQSSWLRDILRGGDWASLEMHREKIIMQLEGCDQARLEMQLETMMPRALRGVWRSWSSECVDSLGGHDRANSGGCVDAVIERVSRFSWRLWLWDRGGRNRATLEDYLEVVDGRRTGWWDSFCLWVNLKPWECDKVSLSKSLQGELVDGSRSGRGAHWKLKLHSWVNT
jgi:hypothetical protein